MKIYVGHSSDIDYEEKLYRPLVESELAVKHELVFPHEDSEDLFDSKRYLREEADIFIAETSKPSTGLGIELGWADNYDVPVICVYQEDSQYSDALKVISDKILSYETSEDMIRAVANFISEFK